MLLQKKYADAEPLLVAAYEGLIADGPSIPPPAKSNIPDAIQRLVQLSAPGYFSTCTILTIYDWFPDASG